MNGRKNKNTGKRNKSDKSNAEAVSLYVIDMGDRLNSLLIEPNYDSQSYPADGSIVHVNMHPVSINTSYFIFMR